MYTVLLRLIKENNNKYGSTEHLNKKNHPSVETKSNESTPVKGSPVPLRLIDHAPINLGAVSLASSHLMQTRNSNEFVQRSYY